MLSKTPHLDMGSPFLLWVKTGMGLPMLLLVALLAFGYYWLTGPYWRSRADLADEPPLTWRNRVLFGLGLLLLYVVAGSPVAKYADVMFSLHMASYGLLFTLMPPLIYNGLPAWAIREMFEHPVVGPVCKFLRKPIFSLVMFNLLFSFAHFPFIMEWMMSKAWAHVLVISILLFFAFVMWLPVASPYKPVRIASDPMQMLYLFFAGLLLTPACVIIIFSAVPVYPTFNEATSMLGINPLLDQQLGGLYMKLITEFVYGPGLGIIFWRWVRKEKEEEMAEQASIVLFPNAPQSGHS